MSEHAWNQHCSHKSSPLKDLVLQSAKKYACSPSAVECTAQHQQRPCLRNPRGSLTYILSSSKRGVCKNGTTVCQSAMCLMAVSGLDTAKQCKSLGVHISVVSW